MSGEIVCCCRYINHLSTLNVGLLLGLLNNGISGRLLIKLQNASSYSSPHFHNQFALVSSRNGAANSGKLGMNWTEYCAIPIAAISFQHNFLASFFLSPSTLLGAGLTPFSGIDEQPQDDLG
jgi:hypothetical protein